MPYKKISQLNAAGPLDGTEMVPIVQDGSTKRTTISAISGPAGSGLVSIDFTNEIPFTAATTTVGAYDMATGDLVLTPNTIGAIPGATAQMQVTGDDSHDLDLSAFKGMGEVVFPNAPGTEYLLLFDCITSSLFTVIFVELADIAAPSDLEQLATPTLTATAVSGTQIDLVSSAVSHNSGYKWYRNTVNNFGTATLMATTATNDTTYSATGLTASTLYYFWNKAAGDNVTYADSAAGTASETTSGAGLVGAEDVVFAVLVDTEQDGSNPRWIPQGNTNAYSAWGGVASKHLPANTEGYYVAKYGSATTTVNVLQWQKTHNGGEQYYGTHPTYGADGNPMVGFEYGSNHFWRGKPGSLGGNGSIGFSWGTNAVDTGFTAASNNLYGMWRDSSMDIHAVTSTNNGASWTDHGVIMNYSGQLLPAYTQQRTAGVVLDTPQQTNAVA